MSNPLHADYYADQALYREVTVQRNEQIARDTFILRFNCLEMAERFAPGQFLMMRLCDHADPLIGRALALYDTLLNEQSEPEGIEVVYIVKGKFTSLLQHLVPGQPVAVWGPLGNGFTPHRCEHLMLVAGGIGQTPFLAVAQEALGRRRYGPPGRASGYAERVTLCYGARNAEYHGGVADFQRVGVEVKLSTDDGTAGHAGLVTELLQEAIVQDPPQRMLCCGPEPMMEAVAGIAAKAKIACEVSLETPMACGVGICFTCVAKVKTGPNEWDYKRTCVEGPVFDAAVLEW